MLHVFKDEYKAKGEEIGAKDPGSLVAMLLYWPMTEDEYNLLPAHVKECCREIENLSKEAYAIIIGIRDHMYNRMDKALGALRGKGFYGTDYLKYSDTAKTIYGYCRLGSLRKTNACKRPECYTIKLDRKKYIYVEDFEDYSEDLMKTSQYKEVDGICSLVSDGEVFYEFGSKYSNLILRERVSPKVLEQLNEIIPPTTCKIF